MNPIFYKFGPVELHVFTAWIMIGVVIGGEILLLTAHRVGKRETWIKTITPWVDCIIGGVIGGIIGARLVHVWLNWPYFALHTDQILALQAGGLDWHGALLIGLPAMIVVALLRKIPLIPLLDALALALPIGAITFWLASAAANAAYGLEVRTLADFPSWLVIESPDIYGTVAPRLNLLPMGIAWAVVVMILIGALTILKRWSGLRLWLAICLYSLGMAVIDYFRADYVATWFDHRADQVLDLALAFVSIAIFAIIAVIKIRRRNS